MPRSATVRLVKSLTRSVRAGHPWLFRDALAIPGDLATGAIVDVVDRAGRFVARGLLDTASPIAVRVWTLDRAESVDAALVRRRVAQAARLRRVVVDRTHTDAFRLVHGEGDRLPGMVCDVYADTAVLRIDTPAVARLVEPLVEAVLAEDRAIRRAVLLHRARRGGTASTLEVLSGPPMPDTRIIREHGLRFEADAARGHKTGLYLDQRENRRRVGALAAGRRVLNLFAYTGGFSVYAAAGGAAAVTTVDVGAPVIDAARRNFALNGLDLDPEDSRWTFAVDDAFDFLERGGDRFDLVIVDPPSMAPSRAALPPALAAYRRLNALALGRVETGGLLFTASCSSHVTAGMLRDALRDAAVDARRDVRIIASGGAGPDHPTLPGFPEGAYLKTLLAFAP